MPTEKFYLEHTSGPHNREPYDGWIYGPFTKEEMEKYMQKWHDTTFMLWTEAEYLAYYKSGIRPEHLKLKP
jgi:hypothetical protein